MSSVKRKAPGLTLQRRVRARRDLSEEPEDFSDASPSTKSAGGGAGSESGSDIDAKGTDNSAADEEDPNSSDESGAEDESEDESEPELAASISFGALAKAQASLEKSGKGKKSTDGKRAAIAADGWENNEALERKEGRKDRRDFTRSSKHAPTEISSKKAVSRKREVVPVAKRDFRDPRFEPISGTVDTGRVSKAYSFLDQYRDDEMKALKEQIRKTKDEFEKDRLKRALLSMESKKKAQIRKAKEEEILDRHRKEEKEKVKQGKQPFYLKKAEQKKQFLVDQYSGLKGKQLDHAIERKRKKVEGKEKKKMPFARRDRGET